MAEQRKILVASFEVVPGPTGTSARLTELVRGLTPVFDVDVLTTKTEAHSHIERYYGARLMRVPMPGHDLPSRALTFERAVRRQLESNEYDLVHVADPFGGLPARQRRAQSPHRIIYDAHVQTRRRMELAHPELLAEPRFMARLARLERHCLLSADLVLTSGAGACAELARLGVSEDRLRIVPLPVDLTRFREAPAPPGELRLAHLGGSASWEGTETAVRALRLLADQGLAAHLVLAGEMNEAGRRTLRRAIAAQRLQGAVELVGPLAHEQIPELLEQVHVCLAPLSAPPGLADAGLGTLKIAEYLAAGRPVVASDTPLYRELLGESGAALFFQPGDAADLAARIRQLARDARGRDEIGDRARARAREAFDAGRSRQALLRAYYDLLDPSIIVTADAYAVPVRAGGHDGEAPTATLPVAADPDTHPSLSDATTNITPMVPPGEAPTAEAPPPQRSAVDFTPIDVKPPAEGPPSEGDWFSSYLPGDESKA